MPQYIPKEEKKYYRDAVISFNCGRTLAALFYLRTFVERYMRRVIGVEGRLRGDELAALYNKNLACDFPTGFAGLGLIYEELSGKIHAADESAEQFEKSRAEIERHFDLLKHFPLAPPHAEKGARNQTAKPEDREPVTSKSPTGFSSEPPKSEEI